MKLLIILLLAFTFSGCNQKDNPKLIIPENSIVLYNTTLPDANYKYRSIAFSLAPIYEMNKKTYKKCMYDSLRTDLCMMFVYTGSEEDKEELKRRIAKDKKMYNTIVYWDKNGDFYKANELDRGTHFIAYVTDTLNQILKMANPTVYNFDSNSLEKLHDN